MFGVKPVTDQVLDRKRKFLTKLVNCVCDNAVCVAVSRAELYSMNGLCYNLSASSLFCIFLFSLSCRFST